MRLTEENIKGWDNKYHVVPSLFSENGMKAIDKLGQYEDIDESPEHLAKIKKALEIIKEKNVWVYHLKQCNSLEEYNEVFTDELHLTQEEYDLLKEVLL